MSNKISILLNDHFKQYLKSQLESGRFTSASEVVRAGLRMLEEDAIHRDAVNKALIAGEQSGFSDLFDKEDFKKRMRNSHV